MVERFEDKTLVKKEDEKLKQQASEAKAKETQEKEAAEKAKEKEEAPKEKKEEFVEERKCVANLSKAYAKPRTKRANAAVRLLKEFCARHFKANKVLLDAELNNRVRGSNRPLKKVALILKKSKDGTVHAYPAQ